MDKYSRGAEWRRWELHMHTPGTLKNDQFHGETSEEKWENFYKDIENYIGDGSNIEKNIAVLAITDYLSIDNYLKVKNDKRLPSTIEMIMPNVELRIAPVGTKKNPINIHCIFSPDIDMELENRFFGKLSFDYGDSSYSASKSELIRLGRDFSTNPSLEDISAYREGAKQYVITHKCLKEVFEKDPELREKTIIVVSNSSSDGVTSMMKHSEYFIEGKSQLDATRQSIYRMSDAIFSSNNSDILYFTGRSTADTAKSVIKKCGSLKPCFHGCDAHTNEKIFQPDGDRYCWIKADPNFLGLKQAINEPIDRVLIGEVPDVIKRVNYNKTKYISSLAIDCYEGKEDQDQIWFRSIEIPLNNELVAIIGNKGNGKSAIADIIALCSDSEHSSDFTFLSKNKFLKKGFAERFNATIKFISGTSSEGRSLAYQIDSTNQPRVQYLPQNYFESVCNEIGKVEALRKEIEKVVFQYVPEKDRLYKTTFSELISLKKENVENEISTLKNRLRQLNKTIIQLEDKKNPEYKKTIESKLVAKKNELDVHIQSKPIEKINPAINGENEAVKKEKQELEKWELELKTCTDKVEELNTRLMNISVDVENLQHIRREINSRYDEISSFINEKKITIQQYGLDIEEIFKIQIDTESIDKLIESKNEEEIQVRNDIGESVIINDQVYEKLKWKEKIVYCNGKIKAITSKFSKEEQEYQKYKDDLKTWEQRKREIEGSKEITDTLKYYEHELKYLNEELIYKLQELREERVDLSLQIYDKKLEIKAFYDGIKKNIDEKLQEFQETNLSIDSMFSIEKSFVEKFMKYILKNKAGSFRGVDEGSKLFREELLGNLDVNAKDSVTTFLNNVINYFEVDMRTYAQGEQKELFIGDQIIGREEFYTYLFSLDYIETHYELRQNKKELEKLSPGEKGALLLVFYLILDKSEIPLIIDQPEDNLDNESVAKVLVPFIRQAKKRRQIIMVTHNPNLAVVADAEQIICTDIDKTSGNKFTFISGSIENSIINNRIVDVLEGTMPAFSLRERKYHK